MSRFAQDRRVFFVEEPVFDGEDPLLELTTTTAGPLVAVPHLPRGLAPKEAVAEQRRLLDRLREEHEVGPFVCWYSTPMAVAFTRHLRPLVTVYDCMDELSAFAGAPAELRRLERELLERADLVFAGGQSLYQAKRGLHPDVYAFPSGVDAAHFRRARSRGEEPADQARIERPRLGFYGVLDERLDLELVTAVAAARPDWQVVLVGPVVKIDPATVPRASNIHYLGHKSYDELPEYIAGWDIAIMPFARNDATAFISPTKTLEYLAAGKPVVSTAIRDVVHPYGDEGLVGVADGAEAFVEAVELALSENGSARVGRADRLLARASWDRTYERMRALVESAAEKAAPVPRRRAMRRDAFDYLVVGAGYAGSVIAERLARQAGERVLVVDRRPHIAGNAYDHYDDAGVLVHRYGPHIFHTNSREVFDYLSQFTEWRPYEHRVLASVDGRLVPFPINLDTVNGLYGLQLSALELEEFLKSIAEPVERCRTSEDAVVSKVGRELYHKFFRNYTRKQWDLDPSELDASVAARVPARLNRDDRYFTDTYQAMPLHGYTRMFERMLAHPNIKVLLNTDYREVDGLIPYRRMVYTGPIDEYFDYCFGELPYRSLEFRFETHDRPVYQPGAVVNYPNEHAYTRVTEFKYLTGQEHHRTTIVYEYPRGEGDPYYPIPRPENAELYKRYKELADERQDVAFVGRLATYKYYNMDQVVAQALAVFRRMYGREGLAELEAADAANAPAPPASAVGGDGVHPQSGRRRVLRPT
jgi:UDP-galactopyranose mutase